MSNIEQLIEAVQIEGVANRELLSSSVEFEELQLEALFEIQDVLVETRDGLFGYFEIEQQRYKENQLAEIERLRELTGVLASGPAGAGKSSRPASPTDAAAGGGSLGVLGTIGGLTVLKSLMGFLPRLLPFLGLFAAGGVIVSLLRNLDKAQTAGSETVGMDVAGDVAGDIYDFAVLPVLSAGLNAMAKEVGYNEEELRKSQEALKEFRTNVELAGEDIFRDLKRFLGEELAPESAAESEERIGELRTELREVQQEIIDRGLGASPGGEIETGLARLEEIKAERKQISDLPFTRSPSELRERQQKIQVLSDEQRKLEDRLEPVFEEQRIQSLISEEQRKNFIAQQGFEMEPVTSQAQINFAEMTSEEKVKYVEDNMEPQLKSAVESGAVKRLSLLPIVDDMFRSMAPGAQGIPVELGDIDSLSNLSVDQLEALRINDDILRNSALQTGALTTTDRNVLEVIYATKTLQPVTVTAERRNVVPITPMSSTSAQLNDTPIQSNVSRELQPVSANRSFDVMYNDVVTAPLARASQEISDAQSSTPVLIANSKGGDTVNHTVNNNHTTVMPTGVPARSQAQGELRRQNNMQGTG